MPTMYRAVGLHAKVVQGTSGCHTGLGGHYFRENAEEMRDLTCTGFIYIGRP